MNKISVIIPVYNGAQYLERCFDSILNQSYKDIEIVAIDDGSTDNSYQILQEYKRKYPTIMSIETQSNMGISITRNRGIKKSTGNYIMFSDNDDFYEPDCFKILMDNMNKTNSEVVVAGYKRPNSHGKVVAQVSVKDTSWSKFVIMAAWSKLYKRDLIIQNDITFLNSNIGEDIYFNLQAMLLAKKVTVIPYIGYNWFYNEKSVSNTLHKENNKDLQEVFLFEQCIAVLKEKKLFVEKNHELIEYFFIKHMIWFILYSMRGKNIAIIKEQYENIFTLLKQHFPGYIKNQNLKLLYKNGELFNTKVYIYIFICCIKTKSTSLLFLLLSKV